VNSETSDPHLSSLSLEEKNQGVLRKMLVACYQAVERLELEHHERKKLIQDMISKSDVVQAVMSSSA
jgi:hypothetical protein